MCRSCDIYEKCEKVENDEDILNIVEIFVRILFSDIPERRYNLFHLLGLKLIAH